ERSKLVGSILIGTQWCYPEWKQFLKVQPEYREIAFEIFRRYPESGFIEALRVGWKDSTS
ncbi:MAG: hypothetical protein ACYTX0_37745, partial [Nostoc sp.]